MGQGEPPDALGSPVQPTMNLRHFVDVEFDDGAVVGHQAVHLALDVGRLGIDGGGQPGVDHRE